MSKLATFCYGLLIAAVFTGCNTTGSTGNEQNIGMVAGAVLGGLAGSQLGDGGTENIVAGALIGGLAGNLTGKEIAKRREALQAAEAQRQQAYQQELQRQREIEAEILRLEREKVEAVAEQAKLDDEADAEAAVPIAEIDAKIASQQKARAEKASKIKELDEEGERIAKAMAELDELEAGSES